MSIHLTPPPPHEKNSYAVDVFRHGEINSSVSVSKLLILIETINRLEDFITYLKGCFQCPVP